jgi:general stress protein CsbA
MKLLAIILFSLSVVLLVIGIHQVMLHGFAESYWIFMFSTFSFLGYGYVKNYKLKEEDFLVNSEHVKHLQKNKKPKK